LWKDYQTTEKRKYFITTQDTTTTGEPTEELIRSTATVLTKAAEENFSISENHRNAVTTMKYLEEIYENSPSGEVSTDASVQFPIIITLTLSILIIVSFISIYNCCVNVTTV
jgi:hypothetical protein